MALRAFADGRVFGEVVGNGPPKVLALHGWGRRSSDFASVLRGFDAISLDLPGFGASPAPSEPIGASGYAELVAPVLEQFEIPPVILGHSFGGRVAVCLAALENVSTGPLVLTGVPLLRRARTAKPKLGYRIVRSMNRLGLISDDRLEAERRRRGSADYRAATGVMRDILVKVVNESYESELALIAVPVTMIWGGDDTEVPVSIASAAIKLVERAGGDATLEVIDGVGHHTPLEAPTHLITAVEEALGR